jgi:hypothetical protein
MSRGRHAYRVAAALATVALSAIAATPAAAVTKKVAAKPANGTLTLYLPDAYFVNRQPVTVPNRVLHVDGIVRPYVPGQWVTVRSFLAGRVIKTDRLRVKPSPRRLFGRFSEALSSPGVGDVTVTATHARTSKQVGLADHRTFSALDQNIGFGSTGRFVELIQAQLAALHFYTPQSGVYDQGTGLALDAYHRLLGWGTYQTLDSGTVAWLLNGWGTFKVRFPNHGTHAEGDLTHQLLALVKGANVDVIFPISSGKPSTPTILGDFQIYRRVPYFRPDGMYFSSFFISGYAIHGYNPAPDYPASHGCMRLPMTDAITVYNWLSLGDWVDTYY